MDKPFTPLLASPRQYTVGSMVCIGIAVLALASLAIAIPIAIASRNREAGIAAFFFPPFIALFASLLACHLWPGVLVRIVAGLAGAAFLIACLLSAALAFGR